jgi:hypothetical protein
MKNKIKTLIVLFTIFSNTAYSQLFVTNPFTGSFNWATNGNVTTFPYNGLLISNVDVGNFTKVNVTTSSSSGNFRASSWTTNSIIDTSKYFEFTLTADPGTTINMSSINFGIGRSATGPIKWEWRTSIDNYATVASNYVTINTNLTLTGGTISVPDVNSGWTNNTLGFQDFDNLNSITFRFYGFASEAIAGTGGLQGNLTFTGESVSVIPEPMTIQLLLVGLALLGYKVRSRYH